MKTFLWIFLTFFSLQSLYSQAPDSTSYIEEAEQLIQQQKYAAAHRILEEAIQTIGFQPIVICPLIDNVLTHFFWQKDLEIFYLKDSLDYHQTEASQSFANSDVVVFRYPERILKKIIGENPQFARAYKLLGDYYRLKSELSVNDLNESIRDELREKVFTYYHRAEKLGYQSSMVNRWLGIYYYENGQPRIAKEYFLRNDTENFSDIVSCYYLSEIFYQEKQYSQGYNYAMKALQDSRYLGLDMRYNAMHTAALSLYHLGEESRFLDYILQCLQLFPDDDTAYLDLLDYYESKSDLTRMKKIIRQMLLNNPYDEKGFKYLERFCVKNFEFDFGIALFDEMMVKYEYSDQAMGNIYRFRGDLLFQQGNVDEARRLWDVSRSYFIRYLPEDSPQLKEIGDVSRESSQN